MRSYGKTRSVLVESFLPRGAHPSFLSSRRGRRKRMIGRSLESCPLGAGKCRSIYTAPWPWIGVEMRGKRRLLFINEPSSSNEGRASGWSWLNEHWATIHHPERKKLIISARTLIRFFLNATDPLIKAESRCRIRFHCGQGKRIAPRSNRFVCAIRTYIYICTLRVAPLDSLFNRLMRDRRSI